MYTIKSASLTAAVEQQISTTAEQIVVQSEMAMRQQALLEQRDALVKSLVQAETHVKSLETVPASADMKDLRALQLAGMRDGVESMKAQLAETRAELAAIQSQAVRVEYTNTPPQPLIFGHTQEEIGLAGGFLLLFPLVVALAIRILKRGSSTSQAPIPPDRFARLETAMESIAVEVERLGESQRFASKLLNDAQPKQQQPVAVKPNYERLMRTPV
ncbi:MAG: hypothetical protein ABJB66_04435 [Gemmatimonadaceae bacterium]